MTHGEVMRVMQGKFHYKSTVYLNDGTSVHGFFQPPGDNMVYLTPLEDRLGKAIEIRIADIQRIDVDPLPPI